MRGRSTYLERKHFVALCFEIFVFSNYGKIFEKAFCQIFHYKMINIILFYLLYRVAIHGSYQKRIRTLVFWFLDWQRIYTTTKFYLIENFVKIKIYFLSKNKKISNQMYANTKMVANVLQILNNRMLVAFSIKDLAEKSIKNFFRT